MSEVNLGHRKVSTKLNNERLDELLENGRNLRKSNTYPIQCKVRLNRVLRMSKEYLETTRRNREKLFQEGTLPENILVEEPNPYSLRSDLYDAIIPSRGITRVGYVKEVWVQSYTSESIEINNQSYEIIDPFVHDTKQWIQGFILHPNNLLGLLPSPKIVVKYFRRKDKRNSFCY